ncbi:head GIN domain-containing protein [uncultured Maribacter sp.]|uniref:head GIN domain-containing protein n=1 Tax=uncultured Maribacter sp. TaxID=431308 RepID=UPI002620D868|nr:head GIN domain-containing protein [uncultured Maribacter sp.]
MKKIAILSLSILMYSSCIAQWGKKIKGNGNVTTVNRTTSDYDAISVSGWFDVELVDGSEGKISLKGEENLLDYILTEVKDNKLVIKVEKGVNLKPSTWNNGIIITVPVESISAVTLSGSGDIIGKKTIKTSDFKTAMSGSGDISLDINSNNIDASMSGSGDINLSGTTNNFDATISGSGDIKAFDLNATNVDANISGSADIKVTVKERLKARVSGSGDITYKGNPIKIDTKVSGSGDISKG